MMGMVRDPLNWDRWPEAQSLLARSIAKADDCTSDEVERQLARGKAQLWVAIDGDVRLAGVTTLLKVRGGAQCFIWHLAGDMIGFGTPLLAAVETWARSHGCKSIEGNMRPGFERALPDWRKTRVVMNKELC